MKNLMNCNSNKTIRAPRKIKGATASIFSMCLFLLLSAAVVSMPISIIGDWWEFSIRHPGIVLVLVGVFGEAIEIFSKIFFNHWYEKHETTIDIWGGIFWIVVMIGLSLEIPEASKAEREAESLHREAGTANQLAAESNERSRKLESTNLWLVASNQSHELEIVGLKSNVNVFAEHVLTLADQMQVATNNMEQTRIDLVKSVATNVRNIVGVSTPDRSITASQENVIVGILQPWIKSNFLDLNTVSIDCESQDSETLQFEHRMFEVFERCGCSMGPQRFLMTLGPYSPILFGVELDIKARTPFAIEVINALQSANIPFIANMDQNMTVNGVEIRIGKKPEK